MHVCEINQSGGRHFESSEFNFICVKFTKICAATCLEVHIRLQVSEIISRRVPSTDKIDPIYTTVVNAHAVGTLEPVTYGWYARIY